MICAAEGQSVQSLSFQNLNKVCNGFIDYVFMSFYYI